MAEDDPVGPSLVFSDADGADVPVYLVSFDKQGACISPRTRAKVLAEAASGRYTDLHIYSHGWNNVFDEALRHYTEFFTEYFALNRQAGLDPARYKPLIVGILWPSTALLASDEATPQIAAGSPSGSPGTPPRPDALAEVSAELAPEQAQQLAALVNRPGPLVGEDALALARLLTPVLDAHSGGARDEPGTDAASGTLPGDNTDEAAQALLQAWGTSPQGARPGAPGSLAMDDGADARPGLEAGGLFEFLNPRELLRKATVYIMKDRAGLVGRSGVGPLVRDAVASGLRVHLTGHSYGARVMLSALTQLPPPQRVTSVLLLQPAISAWCFAERIAEQGGRPGGYRQVLDRTTLPLLTSFSPHDRALSSFYPLALRRRQDEGEIEPGGPPGRFSALGGTGPLGMAAGEVERFPIPDQGAAYAAPRAGVRVRALDGTVGIGGHGDVRNRYTEWALANLVRQAVAA